MGKLIFSCFLMSLPFLFDAQTGDRQHECFKVSQKVNVAKNDSLIVINYCNLDYFEFQLTNRWGEVLYTTKNLTLPIGVDFTMMVGKKKKQRKKYATGNIYIWTIKYRLMSDESLEMKIASGQLYLE